MSDGHNKVEVEIHGERYTLIGDAAQETMIKLALDVDEKMKLVLKRNSRLSLYKAAILVALNFAEELHNAKQEYENLVGMLEHEGKKKKK